MKRTTTITKDSTITYNGPFFSATSKDSKIEKLKKADNFNFEDRVSILDTEGNWRPWNMKKKKIKNARRLILQIDVCTGEDFNTSLDYRFE